jgi:N-acetylmuramoyl-L-alanine amidase
MLPFAYYLLKITICSALLFGYYWFLLRNKVFHGYNRFYLLAIVGLSILLPLCRINIFAEKHVAQTSVIKMLQVVTDGDEYMDEVIIGSTQKASISVVDFLPFVYALVSIILFALLIQMLLSIFLLAKKHAHTKIEHIHFINTEAAKGTPFSFFKYIFWNNQIDMHSSSGARIFRHELAHIKEQHSLDKMFINLVLIAFWCNPIFWLIRKELSMIHEFIADKKAVEDGDTAAFAAMILATTYPQHNITIANNFFYSPIKRRLMMLTKNKKTSVSYISRLLVLPVLVIVFAAFTIKAKEYGAKIKNNRGKITSELNVTNVPNSNEENAQVGLSKAEIEKKDQLSETNEVVVFNTPIVYNDKPITVVIDAGHGGTDPGAASRNKMVFEKDMTLTLVKKIKELNKNSNINIILSRETDVFNNVKEKAEFANQQKPDLFISIHFDSAPFNTTPTPTGMNVLVAADNFPQTKKSKLLASSIIASFKNNYGLSVSDKIYQRQKGIWVLQNVNAPSIIIQAGYIINDNDLAYLQSKNGQETFANNVLNAINTFAVNNNSSNNTDSNKVKTDDEKEKLLASLKTAEINDNNYAKVNASEYLNTFKGSTATNKNGEIIELKTDHKPNNYKSNLAEQKANDKIVYKNQINIQPLDTPKNRIVFTRVEHEPEFPGGIEAWKKYLQANLKSNLPLEDSWNPGKYSVLVKFIVEIDGSISYITTENFKNSKTAASCINIIKNGPKWKPAIQNGHIVAAYRSQPITFVVEDGDDVLKTVSKTMLKIGETSRARMKIEEFKKIKFLTITNGFELISTTVYLAGKGFEKPVAATLLSNNLAPIQELLEKCEAGSSIIFTNVKVKSKNDGIRTIDEVAISFY